MLDSIKQFIEGKNPITLIIIIAFFLIVFISIVAAFIFSNSKKKKCRKTVESLRNRILTLKQTDVIKNYSTYDNLKNDQKLGMLVLRWKKAIEILVREIDAQYSMLDVLDDAIDSNNYQYFNSLMTSFNNDINELEKRAEQLNDEISEYVDKASDNRRYINKYYEMFSELKDKYTNNISLYTYSQENLDKTFFDISKKFELCHEYIKNSEFEEADNAASIIFKEIKLIDHYLENAPKYVEKIDSLSVRLKELSVLAGNFNQDELNLLKIDFKTIFKNYLNSISNMLEHIKMITIEHVESEIFEIDAFIKNTTEKFKNELVNKNYIEKNIDYQKEYIAKIENTAKNFISIFKVVSGSYNITDEDINKIEDVIKKVDEIKINLFEYAGQFDEKKIAYEVIKKELDSTYSELTKISKYLDTNIKIIDEIYSDEKNAREKIAIMTEKINGTKKYIKYANLEQQPKFLNIIRNLNYEVTYLYKLLSEFPIDIVRLKKSLDTMVTKVETTTQEINSIIYKTLLAEFVLLYANRYFNYQQFQNELLIAEDLFYKNNYNKAYEKAMAVLEQINPINKKIVLDKYQEKFTEIFN